MSQSALKASTIAATTRRAVPVLAVAVAALLAGCA
ncbi:pilus assembly protein CpaD, partial [Mesorhizobium sp. M7A.F.Ca.ET.027.02.1.1]